MYLALERVLENIGNSLPLDRNVTTVSSDVWTAEDVRAYLRAWTSSFDDTELDVILQHCATQGLIKAHGRISLTLAGWQHLEQVAAEFSAGEPPAEAVAPSIREERTKHATEGLAVTLPAETSAPVKTDATQPLAKSVFISYSWDDDAHKKWVRQLAERLVANGVHAYLDQWDVQYGDSLTQFMETALPAANYVLVVCTPNYAAKSNGRAGGVGYEAQIISAHVASGVLRSKFVPVVRSGDLSPAAANCSVPPHFQSIMAIDMRNDTRFDEMFERLIRHIYGQPLLRRPPLGAKPDFLERAWTADNISPLRLANFEIEGWELKSGVVQNQLYPKTFQIPEEAQRREVTTGDFVKVAFEYVYRSPEMSKTMAGGGERMWLEVVGFSGPYLVGRLRNYPTGAVEHDLSYDSTVVFLPEHVISIDKQGEDARSAQ
jgi:hypothetical protein